jgi:pimeloyl-ACP methyl ester carboxylesterase
MIEMADIHVVRDRGCDTAGIPFVLVHGVGSDHSVWDGVTTVLGRTRDIVRYDLRGHGESVKSPRPYTLDGFAADHLQVLDRCEVDQCHLVGFSLGGLIAQRVAISRPDRVRTLTLISTVAGRTTQERMAVESRAARLRDGGAAGHVATAVDRWFTEDFARLNPQVVEERRQRSLRNEPDCYAAAYEVLASTDLADELGGLTRPTLVITGERDTGSTPRMARLMAERIPHARAVILPRLKHSLLLEAPDIVGREITKFTTQCTGKENHGQGTIRERSGPAPGSAR